MTLHCCCLPSDDSEEIPLTDSSRTKSVDSDRATNDREAGKTTQDGYREMSDSRSADGEADNSKKINHKTFCGYGLAFLGVIGLSSGLACTQALDQSIPHSELNGFRFLAQFLIASPLLLVIRKCDVKVEKKSIGWLVFGAFVLTLSSYMGYGSAYYLPLGVASGMTRSLGLVMNYIISCIVNRTVKWYEFIAAILCLTGVLLVTQPAFMFPGSDSNTLIINNINGTFHSPCRVDPQNRHQLFYQAENTSLSLDLSTTIPLFMDTNESNVDDTSRKEKKQLIIGYILCVMEAVISTVYIQLVSRRLGDLNIFVYNFWTSIFGFIVSFCIMGASETPVFPTISVCILFLFVHMISAGTHNILLFRAYQLIDPVVAALILTLQIISTFVLQYTVLSGIHPGRADAFEIIGAVSIFLGNALVPAYQAIQSTCMKRKQ